MRCGMWGVGYEVEKIHEFSLLVNNTTHNPYLSLHHTPSARAQTFACDFYYVYNNKKPIELFSGLFVVLFR